MGLKQIPVSDELAANTLSAPYYPDGIAGPELVKHINQAGVIVAGGLHVDLKAEYFRIGHMGVISGNDVLATIGAIEQALYKCGYEFSCGKGLEAAQIELT